VALDLSRGELIRLLADEPIDFGVSVSNDLEDAVTLELAAGERLELHQPALELRITGTFRQPQGAVRASLARANWQSSGNGLTLPRFENARLELELHPDSVQLNRFEFDLEGQPVLVQGSWPLEDGAWEKLLANRAVPDFHEASARVLVERAELAPLAQHFPALLTSQGEVHVDLNVRPGLKLDGFLALTNAMTRPLGPLAPVREIQTMVSFSGSTARVDRFVGRLGGSPVHATGEATLSDTGELLYSVQFHGTNAPLVREPGLLLRANLDLSLEKRSGQNPKISGSVQLRDGLLLQDVSSMLVDRLERPSLHPPYFSITNLPFAHWQLDVKITGDRFLRVRSPAFAGALSADGQVQGSLGRPAIKADVRVPAGRILFPFGRLEVERAYATLSGEDPRGPVMDIVATGQNFNYNVRLEVTGTMDNLNVLFTSTPPLSSEEILLMLTAGELPNQEITYSAEARAGRLITYLGREMVTRFFGNEMSEERLIINSGENIARSGRATYSIEYRLTPRWSLVGEYDEFNALNAGLKWRVYSR
jgi:translocation and assembly module TamB